MDVSDVDSLFDFFADVPRAKSHAREKSQTLTEPLKTSSAGSETQSRTRNVTVENDRQIQRDGHMLLRQNRGNYSDDVFTAASLHSPSLEVDEASVPEYEDDFESTPCETSDSFPTLSGREDSCIQGSSSTTDSTAVASCSTRRRHPTQMSPGHPQHKAVRNIWNGDQSIRGCYHITKAGVQHKDRHSAERRATDRRQQRSGCRLSGLKAGYKDINKRFDGKNTIHVTSSRSRKRGVNHHSSSSGTNSGFGRVKDAVESELSLNTSSDDIHLNNFSERSVKMASGNKVSLPKVDRSGRVQLTRPRGDRSLGHRATGHRGDKTSSRQPRTYVSMTGKDNARSGSNKRQSRKPAIPIPLKSEAIYCDGELTVNVRGDRRGNPDKNKFNVTITVVHKHAKSRPTPYLSRQTRPTRMLPLSRPLDWDIVQHRAVFPGFNTSTDPEVNRRYLQQFGL